eukprot:1186437-Prorocentrum_minimum.AAC.6
MLHEIDPLPPPLAGGYYARGGGEAFRRTANEQRYATNVARNRTPSAPPGRGLRPAAVGERGASGGAAAAGGGGGPG